MYEKELQHLGLSEKEARVYIASLELGADTAQHIAQKATINRATTYVQIEALKKKGLMSEFEKGKKTLYVVESPDRLQSLLRVFEKELDLKKAKETNADLVFGSRIQRHVFLSIYQPFFSKPLIIRDITRSSQRQKIFLESKYLYALFTILNQQLLSDE